LPFLFEEYVLDPFRRELRRAGELVALEPQVFDLIHFLVQERERVVSKDDLIHAIWKDRIVSESTLTSRINAARRAVGDSGEAQRLIRTVTRKGFRFVGEVREEGQDSARAPSRLPAALESPPPNQKVGFCRTPDGINLAVASVGQGAPLVKTANWLNHVEHDWNSPIWAPLFRRLAVRHQLIRYDARGNGLSDWHVADISFEAFERDLEVVVDALDLPRFALFGMSQGAAVAAAYAARFPERVSKLVLYGAYPLGRNQRGSPEQSEVAQAFLTIMRHGWGDPHSAFMQAFSSVYLPGGSAEHVDWFVKMQQVSTSAENAVRIRRACDEINVLELLPSIRTPTLVLHARDDNVVPFEQGRLAATSIPGARFVALESRNHVLLPDEPAWDRLLSEIEAFLTPDEAERGCA